MNFKLSLFITLVVAALTVLAQPPKDPANAQENGQALTESEINQVCVQLGREANIPEAMVNIWLGKRCLANMRRCNKVICDKEMAKKCNYPTCKKWT